MRELIGLIPAAGTAHRLGALPCSKEIFPIGFRAGSGGPRPRPVCDYLLESFRRADIERAVVVLRRGKWDVPSLLGSGSEHGLHLAYRVVDATSGVPETLDAAYPFVAENRVALGFPDLVFTPRDAFSHLLRQQEETQAEIVLGLFPTDRCEKTDMVEVDAIGRVRRLVVKQPDAGLTYTWSIAVWGPEFSRFLHDFVRSDAAQGRESSVGDVIQAALDHGTRIETVAFPDGMFLDIGTPEELKQAVADLAT